MIADGCLVVDALGNDVRSTLIDRYVSIELKEYRQIFRTTDRSWPAGQYFETLFMVSLDCYNPTSCTREEYSQANGELAGGYYVNLSR